MDPGPGPLLAKSRAIRPPLSAPVGLGLWVRAEFALTHAQLLAWLSPWSSWPLLSPRRDHSVSTVSGNG